MEFDIIEVTEEDLNGYTAVQMQLLRTAQKNKNELLYKLEQDIELFKKLILTEDTYHSSLMENKRKELTADFERKVEILREQLLYSLSLSEPEQGGDDGAGEDTGYIVDYRLSYSERYIVVRDYYLSIPDPAERMALYSADETAQKYLGTYYNSLYNVLATLSK